MAPAKKQKKAVLYARYSPRRSKKSVSPKTISNPKAISDSAEAQLEACRRYCTFQNMEIIGEYKDELISGKSAENRPGFQKAINQACEQKAILVVYSMSRFARSLTDAILYWERLQNSKADLVSLKEQWDTSTPTGRLFFKFTAVIAEWQREQAAEVTKESMLAYQAQGRRMSNLTPYGWMRDPDNAQLMIECDAEQEVLTRIRKLRETGCGGRRIAKILDEAGWYGRNGKPMSPPFVQRLINRIDGERKV